MKNYTLVKNTEWKAVKINNEMMNIPKFWSVQKFEEIFIKWIDHRGISPHKTFDKNQIPLLTTKIVKFGFLENYQEFITMSDYEKRSKRGFLEKNDLIFTTEAPAGNVAIFSSDEKVALGQRMIGLSSIDNNTFFKYLFMSNYFQTFFKTISNGSIAQGITTKTLKTSDVFYPDLLQQTAIADILSAQESIVEDTARLVELRKQQMAYLSEELLSGRKRVRMNGDAIEIYDNTEWQQVMVNGESVEIPVGWSVERVGDVFEIKRGKVISKDYINENKGAYPVYSSATENNGCIGYINTYDFDGEYLTWNTDGYAGNVFYRNGKFNCTNVCGTLLPKTKRPIFALKFILEPRFKKNVVYGSQLTNLKLMSNHVSLIDFKSPTNVELSLIAEILTNQEKLIEQTEQMLALEKKKMDYLMNSLLSGEYRVEIV